MNQSIDKFYQHQSVDSYDSSHEPRFNFLVPDLGLDKLIDQSIGDFGCGYGPIFKRLPQNNGNLFVGFDGADLTDTPFKYFKVDLSYENFSEKYFKEYDFRLDYAMCFETMEHLTNPYHALCEIKKILKEDGILYLSIPTINVLHNTIYPSLLYPVDGFKEFLGQMAFEIKDHRVHDKAFSQEVFTLINKPWSHSKMRWSNPHPKFRNLTPIEFINL